MNKFKALISVCVEKLYKPVFLPIVLFGLAYLLLVITLVDGNVVNFLISSWGLAVALMIIGVVYIESIFTTPKDAVINSLNVLILSVVFWDSLRINFWITFVYSLLVLIAGILFLIVYDQNRKISRLSKIVSVAGKAKVIFPLTAGISFLTFKMTEGGGVDVGFNSDILYLFIYVVVFMLLTSSGSINWVKNLPRKILNFFKYEDIGIVTGNQAPNIVLVKFKNRSNVKINDLIVIGRYDLEKFIQSDDRVLDVNLQNRVAIVLDFLGMQTDDDSVIARLYLLNEPQKNLNSNNGGLIKVNQESRKIDNPELFIKKLGNKKIEFAWKRRDDIVGIVSSNTTINQLKGEIIRHRQLENAQLVSCINEDVNEPIRYQIIDAETKKDSREERDDFGYTQLFAYQLGEWRKPKNEHNQIITNKFQSFFEFPWVPSVNSLVYKWNDSVDASSLDETGVDKTGHYLLGTVPKTNLPIYLNISDLVSHHTAILGVTGAGKSTLVFKLIREIEKNDTLTICLDITGEYRQTLNDHQVFFDDDTLKKWQVEADKIVDARKRTQYGFNDTKKLTKEDAEKIEETAIVEINKIIDARIIELRKTSAVTILDIPEISNTNSSIDFTQHVIQAILQYAKRIYSENILKAEADRDNFKCCLILEEAHTLVPENLGVGGDYGASKAVVDKISQIALQGRKYNVGFILISQRTATVKKTVLNQCNTMIAFRAYDETSFNFLANYFGDEYVREITHLKNDGDSRQIIVSGKAVVADRPIIVEIKK